VRTKLQRLYKQAVVTYHKVQYRHLSEVNDENYEKRQTRYVASGPKFRFATSQTRSTKSYTEMFGPKSKINANLSPPMLWRHTGGAEVRFHTFLTSALVECVVNLTPRSHYPRRRSPVHIE